MACKRCGSTTPPLDGRCTVCGAPLESDAPTIAAGLSDAPTIAAGLSDAPTMAAGLSDAPTVAGFAPAPSAPLRNPESNFDSPTVRPPSTAGAARPRTGSIPSVGGTSSLNVGELFGARYHIIKLLGVGGMGAVYQAWDQVLEVAVALKVIRPDAGHDAAATEALQRRFKRELLLARQITHKNVVRIHDFGESDDVQYISMPYVSGSDLSTILKREGRLPVDRLLGLAKEVASGLAAAHEAGVVHRDLKPANIMVDHEGSALIMDFGIARSTANSTGFGVTAAGMVVGTVEYMAPEQARGEAVDQRADIYSFGLILNDLLLGRRQGGATGVPELLSRMNQPPPSVRSIDPTIPAPIDAIITKCLQPDAAARYPTIKALLADLESLDRTGEATATISAIPAAPPKRRVTPVQWAAAAGVLVALAASGWALRGRILPARGGAAAGGPTISLAVLPFRNASGDAALDSLGSSLSEVLRTELGQSSRVRTVSSDRLSQVLQDLRIAPNTALDPAALARVADFTSARSVLWGQLTRFGTAIRLDATLQDLDRQQTVPLNAMAASESALLPAISQLAEAVQQNLAQGSSDVLKELKSTGWKPSTASFGALRLYNEGQELARQGNQQAALKSYEAATKQDENFALAFSAMARTYAALGYDTEAAQFSRRAVGLSDALPPQEKYQIAANHYQVLNDTKKAIESYENLAKASPNSLMTQFDLGGLYEQTGEFDRAREQFARVVQLDSKFVQGLLALGRVEIRRGHQQDALEQLNKALTLAIQIDNNEARGDILQAIGIAYKGMGRRDEALKNYQESLEIKRKLGQKRGMAASLSEIAQLKEGQGLAKEAEQSFKDALSLRREIGDKAGIGSTLISLAVMLNETQGRPDDALPLLREALQIRREAGNQSGEALVLNNIGNVYLAKGQYSDAQTYFERALEIREKTKVPREMADTLHNLAETTSKMGRYDEALSRYLRALELRRTSGDRRGAAIESYSIGTMFDYQGRYGAAVKSKQEALTIYRDLKLRDMWLGEILGGHGSSLALSGQTEPAKTSLDEAMTVARELQNPILIAQTSRFQADRLFVSGDVKEAARLADEAVKAAGKSSDKSQTLLALADAAMTAAAIAPSKAVAAQLGTIARDADSAGLAFLSVDSAVRRADTLLRVGDRAAARQEIDRALARAEALGLKLVLARAHYVRGEILRQANDTDARRDYADALRLLEEMKGEEGNQNLLMRADLAAIHAQCQRYSART